MANRTALGSLMSTFGIITTPLVGTTSSMSFTGIQGPATGNDGALIGRIIEGFSPLHFLYVPRSGTLQNVRSFTPSQIIERKWEGISLKGLVLRALILPPLVDN